MVAVYDKDLQSIHKVGQVYFSMAGAPVAANDQTQGYHIGDVWINTVNVIYMCANDATGAAVWKQISD